MADSKLVVAEGLVYIANCQRPDGGFDGLASADPVHFTDPLLHPTIFFAALIAQTCSGLPKAKTITTRACRFLLRHKSEGWSWNYWQRDAAGARMRGYPDDLDDTACALAALWQHNHQLIDGTVMGYIGQQLVAAETAVGGPYQTWLVAAAGRKRWHDVDVVVNANIAYLLSLLGVTVPGLDAYLGRALQTGTLSSSYYLGTIPSLYFISRVGRPQHQVALRRLVRAELHKPAATRTALAHALLLSTACRLQLPSKRLEVLKNELLSQRIDTHWPAAALYVEPPKQGISYYAGSAALTTAFACEALWLFENLGKDFQPTRLKPTKPPQAIYRQLQKFVVDLPGVELQTSYRRALQRVAVIDSDGQISQLPVWLAKDSSIRLPPDALQHLQAASIHGWIAYTLQDDIADSISGGLAVNLSTANVALRQCVEAFKRALPGNKAWPVLVERVLQQVDAANAWEASHARAPIANGDIQLPRLPKYVNMHQLADKSYGHVLATCGVLLAAGYTASGPQVSAWQQFFRHFLIARQLNDDAHDWQEDLLRGQLSAVVCMLLQTAALPANFNLQRELPGLKQLFWQSVVDQVCNQIDHHLAQAAAALRQCDFIANYARYQTMLDNLRQTVLATRRGRNQAMGFLEAFSAA